MVLFLGQEPIMNGLLTASLRSISTTAFRTGTTVTVALTETSHNLAAHRCRLRHFMTTHVETDLYAVS